MDTIVALLAIAPVAAISFNALFRRRALHPAPAEAPVVRRQVEGVEVQVLTDPGGLIHVEGPPVAPGAPRIHAATGGAMATTGDPRFDTACAVTAASAAAALAWLGPRVRCTSQIATALGARLDGRWHATVGDPSALDRVVLAVARATRALQYPPEGRVDELLEHRATTDPDPSVRVRAIELLGQRTGISEALASELIPTPYPSVRFAIGRAGGPGGRRALIGLMRDGSPRWRARAAIALAAMGPGDDVALVEQCLLAALSDPELAEAAADALVGIATPRLLCALAATPDQGRAVRRVRASILGRYPAPAPTVQLAELTDGGAALA